MTSRNGKYDVILADPPWYFRNYSADDPHEVHKRARGQQRHYPCMTTEEICALPIQNLANENCILFLWTCWPLILSDAPRVIKAWGFEYATLGWEWMKLNTSGIGWHIGMGYYTRSNPEPCLLCVRGDMPVQVYDERNLLITYEDEMFGLPLVSKRREHSRKPNEQYGKIERLYPQRRYLELFARRQRAGWDVFGNEVQNSITLPVEVEL